MQRLARRSAGGLAVAALGVASCTLSAGTAHAQLFLNQYLPDVIPQNGAGVNGQAVAPDIAAIQRSAADVAPQVTVMNRARPEYDPVDVQLGNFTIRPNLAVQTGYNSNLFGTTNATGAYTVETKPSVTAGAQWDRAAANAGVVIDDTRYPSESSQNTTNFVGTLGGYYDIGRDQLQAEYTHFNLHLINGEINNAQTFDSPVPYQVDHVHLAYAVPFSRVTVIPSFDYFSFRYQDGTAGGVPVLDSFNSHDVYQAGLTTRYALAPDRDLVFVVRGLQTEYGKAMVGTPKQNSTSVAVLGGLDFAASAVIRFRALFGYEQRDFQSSAYSNHGAPLVEGSVTWTPTEVTTVTGSVGRSIEDASTVGAVGYTFTATRLQLDYEYRRNVIVSPHVVFQSADYLQNQGTEQIYNAGLQGLWMLNRTVSLTANYDLIRRNASANLGGQFTENLILVGAALRF